MIKWIIAEEDFVDEPNHEDVIDEPVHDWRPGETHPVDV